MGVLFSKMTPPLLTRAPQGLIERFNEDKHDKLDSVLHHHHLNINVFWKNSAYVSSDVPSGEVHQAGYVAQCVG